MIDDKGCSKLLHQRKQDPSETNGDNLNNIGREEGMFERQNN
jgi:hypothetical protein